jgi:hypothetical protein
LLNDCHQTSSIMSSRLANVADYVLENIIANFDLEYVYTSNTYVHFIGVEKNEQLKTMLLAIHDSSVNTKYLLSQLAKDAEFDNNDCCYGDTNPENYEVEDEDCEIFPINNNMPPRKCLKLSIKNFENLLSYLYRCENEIEKYMDGLKSVIPNFDDEKVDDDCHDEQLSSSDIYPQSVKNSELESVFKSMEDMVHLLDECQDICHEWLRELNK